MAASHDSYYLPEPSRWPITGSIGLFLLLMVLGATGVLTPHGLHG